MDSSVGGREFSKFFFFTVMYKKQCPVTCSLYTERSVGGGARGG